MVKIKPSYINSISRKIIYIRKFKTWVKYLIKPQKKGGILNMYLCRLIFIQEIRVKFLVAGEREF